MDVSTDFKWLRPINQIVADRVLHGNATLMFMAESWHRLYDQFVPMDTGMLAHDSVDVFVEGGMGIIHHKAPYSKKIYYGDNLKFSKEKHSLASTHWDNTAKTAGKKEQLVKDVEAFIKKGG